MIDVTGQEIQRGDKVMYFPYGCRAIPYYVASVTPSRAFIVPTYYWQLMQDPEAFRQSRIDMVQRQLDSAVERLGHALATNQMASYWDPASRSRVERPMAEHIESTAIAYESKLATIEAMTAEEVVSRKFLRQCWIGSMVTSKRIVKI